MLRAAHDGRIIAEKLRGFVKRRAHVLDAKIGNALEGNAVIALHHFRQMRHGAGALNEVQFRAVAAADVLDARIAGDARDDFDAHALVVVAQNPRLAGQVEFAENIDAVRADAGDVARADEFVNRLARGAIAVLFRAFETFGMHRRERECRFFRRRVCRRRSRHRR